MYYDCTTTTLAFSWKWWYTIWKLSFFCPYSCEIKRAEKIVTNPSSMFWLKQAKQNRFQTGLKIMHPNLRTRLYIPILIPFHINFKSKYYMKSLVSCLVTRLELKLLDLKLFFFD